MECTDTDMMDHDPSMTSSASTDQTDVVRSMLTLARQLIDQGKPSQALQAVIHINILVFHTFIPKFSLL